MKLCNYSAFFDFPSRDKAGLVSTIQISKRKKSLHIGPKSRFYLVEGQVLDFVREQRQQRAVVNVNCLIRKLNNLAPEAANMSTNAKRCWPKASRCANSAASRKP